MDVRAEPGVISQVPTIVVRIFIDDDRIAVPIPITNVVEIVRCNRKVEAAEPEALAVASAQTENMAPAKSTVEVPVFPRMIQMIVLVIAT